ncbi:histidine kinase dimerization/phosphoacceptor domain -containing protein [Methylobacterium gnaphalii]|uniref:Histidine kinase n=1 Tax=Methylobacterium gnaphalii TaxID=1010610 RepID=A0A512JQ61_9HYPH|nr:histidine kinase dimerization/phosphoacceptor domain -containing protein [Methylobacterium gnaphalii]GEP12081.1 histidine kinase [Methylobacterium gnaphalii]GJD71027.1 Phytochrome-like protein cph1 [Methylobacterium gnaphalii]GLS48198.1 histidine kinase [Methylobacterium gnaphalii]
MSHLFQHRTQDILTGSVDLDGLSSEDLDRLDQGVIALDAGGRILFYSEGAASRFGLSAEAVVGRHYFREVAPSTNVPGFYGRFLSGVRRGRLDDAFEFVFGLTPQPLRARIQMRDSASPGRYWVIITPLEQVGVGRSREAVMAAVGQRVRAEPVDPGLCEREPIHIPGSIQPNAVMVAANAANLRILAHSANIADIFSDGVPMDGRHLGEILPPAFMASIEAGIAARSLEDGRLLRQAIALAGRPEERFYAVAHVQSDRVIVELERAPERPDDFGSASPLETELAVVRLRAAKTLDEAARIAANEIRLLTNFESVLVYRFDEEWNGEAIAEDMIPDWNRSLIGLRFPSSDIPAQARALYHKAKSRFVIDRDCVPVPLVTGKDAGNGPIDLTFAQNRTLSPIHLEYQRNLGVNGSMSISIMIEGRLWGLMIGHHRQPHYVAPETRAASTVLTDAFAMRVQEIEAHAQWAEQQAHLDTEGRLVRSLAQSDDFVQALTVGSTTLLDLFEAGGAGIVSEGHVSLIGSCPSEQEVLALAAWLRDNLPPGQPSYTTDALASAHPRAGAYTQTASGLLAAFVDAERMHLLLWFRPEVPSSVTWGGDPRKPVIAGSGSVAVLPRRSFERWVEERRGVSTPFLHWQVSLAEQLAQAVEGVVLRQRRKIQELTQLLVDKERLLTQKDLLTREIDHRVKNSLQIVSAFLHMQRRQVTDPEARQAFAETAGRVMSVARVHDSLYQAGSVEEVDLGQTIENLCNDLTGLAGNQHTVELTAEPGLMVPYQKAVSLSLIATELVTNAFKYGGSEDRGAQVKVSVSGLKNGVTLKVCDDGGGLPEGWDTQAKGTGLGMKLVRAMLEQIGARIEVENVPGACFTVHA